MAWSNGIPPQERRTLVDWTSEDGPVEEWLARLAEPGWRPQYPWPGVDVVVNGRLVHRYALIRDG